MKKQEAENFCIDMYKISRLAQILNNTISDIDGLDCLCDVLFRYGGSTSHLEIIDSIEYFYQEVPYIASQFLMPANCATARWVYPKK